MKKIKYSCIFLSLCFYSFISKASQTLKDKIYTNIEPYTAPESSDDENLDFGQAFKTTPPSAPRITIRKKVLPKKIIKQAWVKTTNGVHSDSDLSNPDEKRIVRPQKSESDWQLSDWQLIDTDTK